VPPRGERKRLGSFERRVADEEAAAGGQESDRRQGLHAVLRGQLTLAERSLRVHLDRNELAQERDDLLVAVGRGVELVAPLAPLRPEVDHDRLAGGPRLAQRGLEVLPPGNARRRLRRGGQGCADGGGHDSASHETGHAPNLTSRARGAGGLDRRCGRIMRSRSWNVCPMGSSSSPPAGPPLQEFHPEEDRPKTGPRFVRASGLLVAAEPHLVVGSSQHDQTER